MDALRMVGLPPLMERTAGNAAVKIGLIDGPVALDHPGLDGQQIVWLPGPQGSTAKMQGRHRRAFWWRAAMRERPRSVRAALCWFGRFLAKAHASMNSLRPSSIA